MNGYSDESDMPPQVEFSTVAHNSYGAKYIKLSYIVFMGWAILLAISVITVSWYKGELRGVGALILIFFIFDRAEKTLKGRGISFGKTRLYHYFSAIFPFIPLLFVSLNSSASSFVWVSFAYIGMTFPQFALSGLSIYILLKFHDVDSIKNELRLRNAMYENYRNWLYR